MAWGGVNSRIDRFLVTAEAMPRVEHMGIVYAGTFTDHEAVELVFNSANRKHSSPFWRMSPALLDEHTVDELVSTAWEWWCGERGQMSVVDWWLQWKQIIRAILRSHSAMLARVRRMELDTLQEQLHEEDDYMCVHS